MNSAWMNTGKDWISNKGDEEDRVVDRRDDQGLGVLEQELDQRGEEGQDQLEHRDEEDDHEEEQHQDREGEDELVPHVPLEQEPLHPDLI